jgi:hypothetical protein
MPFIYELFPLRRTNGIRYCKSNGQDKELEYNSQVRILDDYGGLCLLFSFNIAWKGINLNALKEKLLL